MIQQNVRNAAGGNVSLFCLGFGYDVHYGFLDVMANQNDGLARRIYEASDAALQLQVFRLLYVKKFKCQFVWRPAKARTVTLIIACNLIPKGFYKEVAIPLLLEVNLHYPDSMENSVTTNHFRHLFGGSEIVVAGRLNSSQVDPFHVEVSAQSVRESEIKKKKLYF